MSLASPVSQEQFEIGQSFLYATQWNDTKYAGDEQTDTEKLMVGDFATLQKFFLLLWQDSFNASTQDFLLLRLKSAFFEAGDAIAIKTAINMFTRQEKQHDLLLFKSLATHPDSRLTDAIFAFKTLGSKNEYTTAEVLLLTRLRDEGWAIAAYLLARASEKSGQEEEALIAHEIAAKMGVNASILYLAEHALTNAEIALWYRVARLRANDPDDITSKLLNLRDADNTPDADKDFLAFQLMVAEEDQLALSQFYSQNSRKLAIFLNFEYQFFPVADQSTWLWRHVKRNHVDSPSSAMLAMIETEERPFTNPTVEIAKVKLITAVAQFAMMSVKPKFPELALLGMAPLLNTIYPSLILDRGDPVSGALYAAYFLILIRNCISNAELLNQAEPTHGVAFFYGCAARYHLGLQDYRHFLSLEDQAILDQKGEQLKELVTASDAEQKACESASVTDDDMPALVQIPKSVVKVSEDLPPQSVNHACLWAPKPQSFMQVMAELLSTIVTAAAGFLALGLPGLAFGLLGLLGSYGILNRAPDQSVKQSESDGILYARLV